MSNDRGTIWIVFNGEIYNAPDLRIQLERRGHTFRTTNSDTEVLLHLYEEKGREMLDMLNGMFAFVIHDRRRKLLFGARDRMGIKPLYLWSKSGRFAFASEMKSLLEVPGLERAVDTQSLFHYMTLLYVPGPESIIEDVHRLPPGHCFTFDLEKKETRLECYWQLRFDNVDEGRNVDEWAELLRGELHAAVKRWTLSDVPVAFSLSGGLDSSAVVGLLADQGYPSISTYSLGFRGEDEKAWDELGLARQVASMWGTNHREITLDPDELLQDLVSMVWHLDEPYAGGLPSWYVFREMSKEVKVGFTGTGGDELFGNYGKFSIYEGSRKLRLALGLRARNHAAADMLAQLSRLPGRVLGGLPALWQAKGAVNASSTIPELLERPFGQYYYANQLYFSDRQKKQSVFNDFGTALVDTASYLEQLYEAADTANIRNAIAAVDFRTQLAEEFLFMTDRFSMAHSLEGRVPFLDHELVELVYSIPPSIRTKGGDLKYLFKQVVKDLLPADLLRAPKRGFVIPAKLWLRRELRPLADYLLNADRLAQQGIFRPSFYETYVSTHLSGKADYTWQVWAALMFQLWHVVFVEHPTRQAPTYDWRHIWQ